MKPRNFIAANILGLSLTGFVSESYALNVLICKDDGFTAGNVRALYNNLKTAGHNVIVSAPSITSPVAAVTRVS
jgi:5'-nucleotidase